MATRPIFIPQFDGGFLAKAISIEFTWFPGMAVSRKQLCIRSLHEAALKATGLSRILEISSKSESELGVSLSAFNLPLKTPNGSPSTVESIFQGSKVFENGGPYQDLYLVPARSAKTDDRLRSSGRLLRFQHGTLNWPLEPMTAFYNWLYLSALRDSPDLAAQLVEFEAFSDIEFNPKKSVNCQAEAAAVYTSLAVRGLVSDAPSSMEQFLTMHRVEIQSAPSSQPRLL